MAVTVVSSLVVVVAAFLPWARSGEAQRNSFELVRSAERLDVLSGAARHAAAAWYLMPALVALLWIAATLRHRIATVALGAGVGVFAVVAAAIVTASPLKVASGVPMAGVAGAASLGGALVLAATGWRRT